MRILPSLRHGGWRTVSHIACLFAIAAALGPLGPARAAAEPSLTLTPNQGPCGLPIVARGADFPPGDTVELLLPADPKRSPVGGVARPTVVVGADGTFTVEVVPCTAETPGYDQDGTQYVISAVTPTPDPLARPRAFAAAIFTVGPVAQVPVPRLTLTPDNGACNSPVAMRGENFPPGQTVAFTSFPVRSDAGVQFMHTTVEADGTFALEVEMRWATNCSSYRPDPVGVQYRITALVDRGRGQYGSFASAIYTVSQARLTSRCFPQTGRCVGGRFLEHWEWRGLAINGYPISEELTETLEDGQPYTVQYFERVRMEYHPENRSPYDVLLGQLGRRFHPADPPVPSREAESTAAEPVVYVPQTGHNLRGRFLAYWEVNGGLAQFGYPISEEFEEQLEDGNVYVVQYFERARFEYHPENAGTRYEVLLGQFGRRMLAELRR